MVFLKGIPGRPRRTGYPLRSRGAILSIGFWRAQVKATCLPKPPAPPSEVSATTLVFASVTSVFVEQPVLTVRRGFAAGSQGQSTIHSRYCSGSALTSQLKSITSAKLDVTNAFEFPRAQLKQFTFTHGGLGRQRAESTYEHTRSSNARQQAGPLSHRAGQGG